MAAAYQHPEYEREGGDITASDMVVPEEDSDLKKFYKDCTVLITGGTGFLGQLAMEKLLRTCDVKKIYVIIRSKKGKDPQNRFEELFNEPCFDPLKRNNPAAFHKVHILIGDIGLPKLGLKDEDIETIQNEVDVVLHFAATVRFDEKIRTATYINIRGVRELLHIAKQIKKLRSLIHISTAFSNCVHKTIEEKFYDPPISGEKLITLVDCLDDAKLDAITPTLLGEYPNTYALTKCIAEDILKTEGKTLPIGLHRPSIVVATAHEPVSGWINNIYGATGVIVGVAIGLLRVLNGKSRNYADIVPADYVVNSILAAAWDVASIKTINENKEVQDAQSREDKFENEIPIYNYVSSPENPITWDEFTDYSTKHCMQIPSEKCLWYSYFVMIETRWLYLLLIFLLHTIPAYIVDFVCICIGKKPMLVKGYEKIHKFVEVLSYFCLTKWKITNTRTQLLWKKLKKQDQALFEFNMQALDFDRYFHVYTRGLRLYLLKDPLNTIPEGRIKYYKLLVAHYLLLGFIAFIFFNFFMFVYRLFC